MGQARQTGLHMWLLASRRCADAVACVPTIESSLTPAGAAAVDRARAPRLTVTAGCPNGHAHAALSCEHRPFPVAP
jgi:hypothetical protein